MYPMTETMTTGTTAIWIDERVFCPVCQEKGLKSRVYVGLTLGTLMYCQPYYDEEGNYHHEDPNTYTTSYSCSKGHEWSVSRSGNKEWTSITKDTEDEEEEIVELGDSNAWEAEDFIIEVESDYLLTLTPAASMTFGDGVGKISWENGYMEFEGDAFESARIFFIELLKPMIDDYIKYGLEKGDTELSGTIEMEYESEMILFQITTTGEFAKTFKPEWFLKVDADLSRCLIDDRLRIKLNGDIYWIKFEKDYLIT